MQLEKFSIKQVYQLLRGDHQKVKWRKLICNNAACPTWMFILYLVFHGRLLTKDICEDGNENIEHLFFSCPYSAQVRKIIQEIHVRGRIKVKLAAALQVLDWYPV
ncbi:unnamed protein product [Withania somnifera]